MCIEEISKESIEIAGKAENELLKELKFDHSFDGDYSCIASGMPKIKFADIHKLNGDACSK